MKTDYYVYVYFDPRTTPPTPIYVGKGRGKRYKKHLTKTHNIYLSRKIKHIKDSGLEIIIEKQFQDLTCAQTLEHEVELIAKFGREDLGIGTLCNFTNGGEGTEGYKHKEDTIKLFSEQRKNKLQTEAQYAANCGRIQSEEAKAKISKATKGHEWHTPDQIDKIKKSNSNREISAQTKELWSQQRKGVKQSPEQIKNNQASLARARYLKKVFNDGTITPEELEEYNFRLEKRKRRNEK